jgi:hypothetical protein
MSTNNVNEINIKSYYTNSCCVDSNNINIYYIVDYYE